MNEAWTFGTFNTDDGLATVPPTVVTGTLFSTGSNGGGAYPPAWYRSTYNPANYNPPNSTFVDCGGVNGPNGCTDQHGAVQTPPASGPVIGPPQVGYTLG